MNKILFILVLLSMSGCSSIPMAPIADDNLRKTFINADVRQAGIYIYRNPIFFGDAVTRKVKLDGNYIGRLPVNTYLYIPANAGSHTLSTESSVSDNEIKLVLNGGKNYFLKQSISPGAPLMGAAANLEIVDEETGKSEILIKSLISPASNE